jgi:hypothetical protein
VAQYVDAMVALDGLLYGVGTAELDDAPVLVEDRTAPGPTGQHLDQPLADQAARAPTKQTRCRNAGVVPFKVHDVRSFAHRMQGHETGSGQSLRSAQAVCQALQIDRHVRRRLVDGRRKEQRRGLARSAAKALQSRLKHAALHCRPSRPLA